MNDLASLKSQRTAATTDLARVTGALARLDAVKRDVSRCEAEVQAFADAEADAMREWAESGGNGPPPASGHDERVHLAAELAKAQAATASAGRAYAQLATEQAGLAALLRTLDDRIEAAVLDILRAEHATELADFVAFVRDQVEPRLARLIGLRTMFIDRGQTNQASGRTDAARAMFLHAEAVARADTLPEPNPSPGAIITAAQRWRQRHTELTAQDHTA